MRWVDTSDDLDIEDTVQSSRIRDGKYHEGKEMKNSST